MLTNKMHFLNYRFNSALPVFYMFRTPYVHHQADYNVKVALCVMLEDVLEHIHQPARLFA